METRAERRKRKLIWLRDNRGGLDAVGERAGVSGDFLKQIIDGVKNEARKDGTRTDKGLGNINARKIEKAEGLGHGWFDNDWPFESIDQFRFEALSDRHKGMIEHAARLEMERIERAIYPAYAGPQLTEGERREHNKPHRQEDRRKRTNH